MPPLTILMVAGTRVCSWPNEDSRFAGRAFRTGGMGVKVSRTWDVRFKERGTRFLVYPQPKFLKGFTKPEIVYVNAAPGTIRPGPEDKSIYVVDAVDKEPYIDTGETPPYTGPRYPPAEPAANGHFNHLKPGTRAFSSATTFATIRCVLDIWEEYFGRHLPWYFRAKYPRLEVIPRVRVKGNAWSRPGYLECGFGGRNPLCENFDVVAHEVGHTIIREVVGFPTRRRTLNYRAHEEASADLVAIVSSLHFDSVVDHLLEHTKGNLFSANEFSRIGELTKTKQFRKAFNYQTMITVKMDFDPDPDVYKYRLALPFTGGAFDVFVEIYEQGLIERRAISEEMAKRSEHARGRERVRIQREFGARFKNNKKKFKDALFEAREYFGRLMARTWDKTARKGLTYKKVVANMSKADVELSGGRYVELIRRSFEWRKILQAKSK